ncbi:DUF1565 domain-containing protein [Paenibacillus xylanexedens]|uniref:DUF1565 domain-containing protein n=1 Tax=Paenibacillus xylanexedens TaxID=528191 RepID=UPI0011A8C515|nr:DUF1565 domain-containing protein [Paenibacillus xylanexedens]
MAAVGQVLTAPEPGWVRYDNTHPSLMYTGTWNSPAAPYSYQGTSTWSNTAGSKVTFSFTGPRIRIIADYSAGADPSAKITIDGVLSNFSLSTTGSQITQALVFEKTGLSDGEHIVTIERNTATVSLDAIDVDENGRVYTITGRSLTAAEAGWLRVDSAAAKIRYSEGWYIYTETGHYGGSLYATLADTGGKAKCTFKFYGTKLRILANCFTSRHTNNKVNIDGKEYTYSEYRTASVRQALVFEITDLAEGPHEVTITAGTDKSGMTLDAFDFDSTGYLIGAVGDAMTAPEPGWKRYDDTDAAFRYTGFLKTASSYDTSAYGGSTYSAYKGQNSTVNFKFLGRQLRLIITTAASYTSNIQVTIDGAVHGIMSATLGSAVATQRLGYEAVDLPFGAHDVEVKVLSSHPNADTYDYRFDAVDIDAAGRMLHPQEVVSLQDLAPGKLIRAHYRAASGQQGSITRIGEETAALLNTGTILSPMGDFYFVMVEEKNGAKKLIADRPLQTTIASDTLNTAGYHHTGVPIGSTVYVDAANGVDTNPGTADRPIKTLARALVAAPYSGIVKLAKGTYSASTLHDLTTTKGLTYVGENQDTTIELQSSPQNSGQPIASAAYFRNLVIQPSATFSGDTRFIWYNTSSAVNYFALRFENVLFKPSPGGQYPSTTLFAWTNSGAAFPNVLLKNCTSLSKTPIDGASTRSIDCVYAGAAAHSTTPTTWSNCLVNAAIDTEFHVVDEEKRGVGVFTGKYAWGSYRFRESATELQAALMSGGISATDKDNDWDRFVVSSSLNGTITPGDATFWNITALHNLTRTTLVNGTADRVARGYNGVTVFTSMVTANGNLTTGYSSTAFRPMLIVSDLSRLLVLFRDGDAMKALVDGVWQIVGTYPATPEMFLTYGMETPVNISLQQLRLLGGAKVYAYVESEAAKTMTVQGILNPVLIRAKGDLRLDGVEQIDALTLTASATGNAQAKMIVSKDKGLTWEAYRGGNWMAVNADDLSDVSAKGMTAAELNATPPSAWDTAVLAGQVRFAYYLERTTADEKVAIDALSAQFDMRGRWKKAVHGTDYDYAYPTNSSLQVSLLSDGSYKINYADASTGSGGGGSVTWEEF